MACLFGHKWDGCKCEKCGKTRDENHQYTMVWEKCEECCAVCKSTRPVDVPDIVAKFDIITKDPNILRDVIGKISDQHVLAGLALQASYGGVRNIATKLLTDQTALAIIAKKETALGIRAIAVAKLKDQQLLADIAQNDKSYEVRREAVERLENKSVLDKIARDDPNDYVRYYAALKAESGQAVLAQLAKSGIDISVRHMALEHLHNQDWLADVAKNAHTAFVRSQAVTKIDSVMLLMEIAQNDVSTKVRLAAAKTAAKVGFSNTYQEQSIAMAQSMIQELEKRWEVLSAVLDSEANIEIRCSALQEIKDEGMLFEVAATAAYPLDEKVVDAVLDRIYDQDKILLLAKTAEWDGTRFRAQSLLRKLLHKKDIAEQ